MKFHFIFGIVLLAFISQCNSVTQSEIGPISSDAGVTEEDMAQPELQEPRNNAESQSIPPTLAWKEIPGAASYRVFISTRPDFSDTLRNIKVENNTFQPNGLAQQTMYYWKVQGISGDSGRGPWSETWNFSTKDILENSGSTTSDMWVSAYMASWNHYAPPTGNWGDLPTDEIDWEAFTHLFYFSLKANTDGSLSEIAEYKNMSPDRIKAIVSAAHNNDTPVIITIGGWGNHDGFSQSISSGTRAAFVANIVSLIHTWGFDGIDIDMEPIKDADVQNYKAFIRELNTALGQIKTPLLDKPLLTAATGSQPGMFSDIQQYFDQINLMTYDYSGAWQGWVSWHNSALYDGGLTFPNNSSRNLPSIDGSVSEFVASGIPPSKLGIGIDFYGYVWSGGAGTSNGGITDPNQSWSSVPTVTDNVPYSEIMDKYFNENVARWDDKARAPYLCIDMPEDKDDKFISYDDTRAVKEKINYIRQNQLGGAIIWELSGGYRKDQPAGSRDKLLQSVKNAVWQSK